MIKRGDVYWVDLNKAFPEGLHYQRNIRPCVIISNEKNNKFCDTLTVVPLTTKRDNLPIHKRIFINNTENFVLPEQIMTVDRKYVLNKLYHLNFNALRQVEKAVKLQLGME